MAINSEVAPGIHRLGSSWVNWFLVEEGGRFTVVDSGLPGYFDQLLDLIRSLGGTPDQVDALVLTHNHTDHTGTAERIRAELGATVYIHPNDEPILTGKAKPHQPAGLVSNLWRPHLLKFLGHALSNGGAKTAKVKEATTFDAEGILNVPGKPLVVPTHGHSPGHCALVFQDRDAVIVGDAMATLDVTTGKRGPRVHPFNEDVDGAVSALTQLERLTVSNLLPGHGEPWHGDMATAVRLAREQRA